MTDVGRLISPAEIRDDYFRWLCGLVQMDDPDHSFFILAEIMHNMEFFSIMKNDDNRVEDGIKLRYDFERQAPLYLGSDVEEALDHPCSVLEMLIALATRMEEIMYDASEAQDCTYKWFWEMIENLGLDELDDDSFVSTDGVKKTEIEYVLYDFITRDYDSYGQGGLFPLKYPSEDQRNVEIWYQMQAYLDENYPI